MIKKLKLNTHIDSLLTVEKLIDELRDKNIISEDLYGNAIICATEAVNNAIHHGNKNNKKKYIYFTIEKNNKNLTFDVRDEGKGFDYNNIPDPTLPENIEKLSGRGIFLIKKLADKVEFLNNGSEIKMSFSTLSNEAYK